MAGTDRFEQPLDGDDGTAQAVGDQVREAREQVYFAYLRARERGVGLLDDHDDAAAPARSRRFTRPADPDTDTDVPA